jgi:hypothetical protein
MRTRELAHSALCPFRDDRTLYRLIFVFGNQADPRDISPVYYMDAEEAEAVRRLALAYFNQKRLEYKTRGLVTHL